MSKVRVKIYFLRWKDFSRPKEWVTTEDKNTNLYEIEWSSCEAVNFGEDKWPLKWRSDERKKSFENFNCEKHCWEEDQNVSWDQKKLLMEKAG